MDIAKRLLSKTNYQITDVGEMSGFLDNNYFSRAFKKTTRYTPRDYRKKFGV